MDDSEKTKEELIGDLQEMRQRIASLDRLEYELEQCKHRLQQCETKHQSLLDSSPDPMVVYETSGHALYVNAAFTRTFGWSKDEVLGKRIDYVPEEFTSQTKETLEKLFKGEQVPSFVTRRLTKDGRVLDIHISSALFRDIGGEPVGHIVTLRDITEQRQAEEALRKSEELLSAVLDVLPDVVGVQLPDHTVTRYNRAGYELLGLGPEEIHGRKCYELIGRSEPCQPCPTSRAIRSKKMECLEKYFPELDKNFLCASNPLLGESGEVKLVIKRLTDITELKRAEEALKHSERRYRALFENMGNAVAVYRTENDGGDFIFVDFNRAGEIIDGISRDQVIGKSLLEAFPGVKEFGLIDVFRRVWRTGEPEHHPVTLYRDERIEGWRDNFVYRLPTGEIVSVYSDETEREQAEEKIRHSEEKYRSFVETTNEAVFVVQDGLLRFANPRCMGLTGYTEAELSSKPLFDLIHPDDREMVVHYHQRRLKREEDPFSYSFRIIDKHGNIKWLYVNSVLIMWAASPAALCFGTDISDRKKAEEELRESENKFRCLVDQAADMLFLHEQSGRIVDINQAAVRLTGYTREELLSMQVFDIDPDAINRDDKVRFWTKLQPGDTPVTFEVRHRRKDGSIYPAEVTISKIRLKGGEYILGIARDITERKKAEEALRESEEKYRATFNTASVGIDLVDREGRFLEVNRTLAEFLGYTQEELRHRTVFDVTYPEDGPRSRELHDAMVEGQTDGYRLEKRYVRKDGSILWADISVAAIRDAEGQYRTTVGVIVDITGRKKLEGARIRLGAAVEQASETVVIADPQGTIVYVNPSFERTTGYSSQEAVGNNPRILQSGHHDKEFYKRLWDTIAAGKVWTGHFINKKKDGALFEEDASITPVKDESGKIVNYVAVKRDVSREVSLQKQLLQAQKMEAIGTLAGGIAHDFNNILQITLGFSELLLERKSKKDPEYDDLRKIRQAARSGAALVHNLLTFSRKVEPKAVPLDLNNQIQHIEAVLHRTIPRMIEIRMKLAEGLKRVQADPGHIEQIIMNLAVNARDAMGEKGTLTIQTENVVLDEKYCRLHVEAKPGDHVLLTVSDTGSGMDGETLQHIFEPFYTTKELGRGTGLGLAMVYGIVRQHDGHLTCYSEVGKGTTFRIYLPAIISEPEDVAESAAEMPAFGTETLLLVDDEDAVRSLGERILTKNGYTVLVAGNGEEALAVYARKKEKISLVILDLIMPSMGGKDCLQELLKIDPAVKVLIASGYAANETTKECARLGTKGFVNKPFRLKEFLQQVRRTLDER